MLFRQILRALGKTPEGKVKLRKILNENRNRMTDREFWLIEYTYLKRLSTLNISDKLGLSRSHYQNLMNSTLAKFEAFIDKNTLLELVQML